MKNYYMSVRYCTNYTKKDFFRLFQKDHIDDLSDAHRDLLSPSSATVKLRIIY